MYCAMIRKAGARTLNFNSPLTSLPVSFTRILKSFVPVEYLERLPGRECVAIEVSRRVRSSVEICWVRENFDTEAFTCCMSEERGVVAADVVAVDDDVGGGVGEEEEGERSNGVDFGAVEAGVFIVFIGASDGDGRRGSGEG